MKFLTLHPNLRIRIIVSFFQRLSQVAVFPFMSIYFSEQYNAETSGMLMLISVIVGLLSSLYGGYMADIYGRKKVLSYSEFIRSLSLILMALCNSPQFFSPSITFLAFLANSLLVGLSTPASEAMVVDVSTPETRKYIYGLNYWATNLSIAIGTVLGAFFYKEFFFELLLLVVIISIFSWVAFTFFITETKPTDGESSTNFSLRNMIVNYKQVLSNRLFAVFMLVGVIMLGIEFQLTNYISVRLAREFEPQVISFFQYGDIQIDGLRIFGFMRLENTILVVLLSAVVMRWSSKLNDLLALKLGVVLFVVGYAVIAASNDGWTLLMFTMIFTFGELLYVPIHQAMLAELIDDERRSQYMAVNALRIRGAMMVGSLGITLGAFVPSWGMSILYLFLGLVCFVLYIYLKNGIGKRQPHEVTLKM